MGPTCQPQMLSDGSLCCAEVKTTPAANGRKNRKLQTSNTERHLSCAMARQILWKLIVQRIRSEAVHLTSDSAHISGGGCWLLERLTFCLTAAE